MKSYPSISKTIDRTIECWIYGKLDGSQIRVEYSDKQGFCKFGSRTHLIDESFPILGEAVTIFKKESAPILGDLCRENKIKRAIFYCEFWGKNSLFGQHIEEDHRVTLFDINVHPKGFLKPADFGRFSITDHWDLLDRQECLYIGKVTQELEERVRTSTLKRMPFEGVVCKSRDGKKMFKIKSNAWLDKLREKCNGNQAEFERLS